MKKKTIAVIGLGSIGMRHAENLMRLGHKVCPIEPNETRYKQFVAKGGIPLTKEVKLDGVVIASPTDTHFDIIEKYSDKNLPTFVEKPLGGRGAPITANVIMVGYNLRFHHCVRSAKNWLTQGLIGQPEWANLVCAQYNDRPDYKRDGVILNWSHEIDLALYLLGPARLIGSMTKAHRGYDSMTDIMLAHTKNGCHSVVHLDYVTMPEIRQSIIVGDQGAIIMDLKSRHAWLRGRAGIIMDQTEARDSYEENYLEEMKAFIDRIDGKNTLGCTVEEGLAALKICLNVRTQAGLT